MITSPSLQGDTAKHIEYTMAKSTHPSQAHAAARPAQSPLADTDENTIDSDELLTLLSDEYARSIIEVIQSEALPAREIAERLDVSRATVYRRLNRLDDAGVLKSSVAYNPEGNHRQQFHVPLDRVQLSFTDDGIEVTDVAADDESA